MRKETTNYRPSPLFRHLLRWSPPPLLQRVTTGHRHLGPAPHVVTLSSVHTAPAPLRLPNSFILRGGSLVGGEAKLSSWRPTSPLPIRLRWGRSEKPSLVQQFRVTFSWCRDAVCCSAFLLLNLDWRSWWSFNEDAFFRLRWMEWLSGLILVCSLISYLPPETLQVRTYGCFLPWFVVD